MCLGAHGPQPRLSWGHRQLSEAGRWPRARGAVIPGVRTPASGVVGGNVAVVCDSPGHACSKETGSTSQETAPQ